MRKHKVALTPSGRIISDIQLAERATGTFRSRLIFNGQNGGGCSALKLAEMLNLPEIHNIASRKEA